MLQFCRQTLSICRYRQTTQHDRRPQRRSLAYCFRLNEHGILIIRPDKHTKAHSKITQFGLTLCCAMRNI